MCLRNTLDAASKASGYRPDLLHFLPKGKKIMVSNPSSRVRADVHRTSAFDLSNLVGSISPNKKDILVDVLLFVINTHFRYFYGGYIGKYIEINIFSNIFFDFIRQEKSEFSRPISLFCRAIHCSHFSFQKKKKR